MRDIHELQQKQQTSVAPDPGPHFERDDCMSYDASCSSLHNPIEEDDGDSDPLVRRRRRSNLDGDDLAESSAARRRHSRILSRWAARQAQEMITTIERRNQESELMALAGLHPVSMLDYSFLRESQSQSPTSRRQGPADERPSTRASLLLQMWRELEDDSLINRARDRLRHQRSVDANTDVSTLTMSESRGAGNQGLGEDAGENEHFGTWSRDQIESHTNHQDGSLSSREPSLILRKWRGRGSGKSCAG